MMTKFLVMFLCFINISLATPDISSVSQGDMISASKMNETISLLNKILDLEIINETPWTIESGGVNVTATVTPPQKGTPSLDLVRWKQIGDEYIVEYRYRQTVGGVMGNGGYIFHLPSGLEFDDSILTVPNLAAPTYSGFDSSSTVGHGSFNISGGGGLGPAFGLIVATSSTTFQVRGWQNGGGTTILHSSGSAAFSNANLGFGYFLRFKGKNLVARKKIRDIVE